MLTAKTVEEFLKENKPINVNRGIQGRIPEEYIENALFLLEKGCTYEQAAKYLCENGYQTKGSQLKSYAAARNYAR